MRIWIVNAAIVPPTKPGGTRHHVMAKRLAERHEVTLITSNNHYTTLQQMSEMQEDMEVQAFEGVRYLLVRIFRRPVTFSSSTRVAWWVGFSWRLLGAGKRLPRPDVIVGSSPNLFQAMAAEWLARRYKVPFVLEVRDLWPDTLIRLGGYGPRNPVVLLLRRMERYLYRRARRIVLLLAEAAPLIASRGGVAEHIVPVPNGVDFDLVATSQTDVRLPEDRFNVLYTGSHGIANALDAVLDAAARVQAADPGIHFTFVGEGEQKARLVERARAEGLGNVTFLPPVPKQEVHALLQQADAFVVNARNADLYEHGVSFNKIFDYLAAGRPTVFAVGSPIMEQAQGGLTVTPDDPAAIADAVLRLRAMPAAERERMGQSARAYVEAHHNVDRLAATFEQALVDACLPDRRLA